MPHDPHFHFEGKPPDQPHLAIMHDDGMATAYPPGAYITIVEDPRRLDKIFPLILVKVDHNFLDFRCACGQKDCTRGARFRAEWRGHHRQTHLNKVRPMENSPLAPSENAKQEKPLPPQAAFAEAARLLNKAGPTK